MNKNQQTKISKRLSLILRHNPQSVGLSLGENGWVEVQPLLDALTERNVTIDEQILNTVVNNCAKQRFEFDQTKEHIRARQGHSVEIDLGYTPTTPPDLLYHGTPKKFVDAILEEGLKKQRRHHVHMSENIPLMLEVARRRGEPRLLEINAKQMADEGHEFYLTDNNVWLCSYIPPKFITLKKPETLKI